MAVLMPAADVRRHLASVSSDVLDTLLRTDPTYPAGDPLAFHATQDVLADWVADWELCRTNAGTPSAVAHVTRAQVRAQDVKGWLVRSVTPLAYRIANVSDGEHADEVVQELLMAVVAGLPAFNSSLSAFHKFAAARMRNAKPAGYEQVFGRVSFHVPDSWRHIARLVRRAMAQGLDEVEAAEAVRADLLGPADGADFARLTARHIRSGYVSALNNVVDVLRATDALCALDAPSGADSPGETLSDIVPVGDSPVAGLNVRIAALCGVDQVGVGDALAVRLGVDENNVSRSRLCADTGVTVAQLGAAEAAVRARVKDPLAWFVWLDPQFDPAGVVAVPVSVVW